jgi:RimJ/RimL family protein N-acetyltransferase
MAPASIITSRLEVRAPREADGDRFVGLFQDPRFMEFSKGPLSARAARDRFQHMRAVTRELAFAKQPVVERSSGVVIGYTGVDYFQYDDERRLEWGYRLVPEVRGLGYATEASLALLGVARQHFTGEILAIIDPSNEPSRRVISKLGFAFRQHDTVEGELRNIYGLAV